MARALLIQAGVAGPQWVPTRARQGARGDDGTRSGRRGGEDDDEAGTAPVALAPRTMDERECRLRAAFAFSPLTLPG
jgi:hypothetical protein